MPIKDNRNPFDRASWTQCQVTIDWIESCLVNDEASSDEELVSYLIQSRLSAETAKAIIAQRNRALLEGIDFELDLTGLALEGASNGL